MRLNELKSKTKPRRRKRVGRGGKKGTYSGRGLKGQKARSGRKMRPAIRDLIKRYPKLRGHNFDMSERNRVEINIGQLEKKFQDGEVVSPRTLLEKGIIKAKSRTMPSVKILSQGEITKKLSVQSCQMSAQAKAKLEKAGIKILQ